MWVEETFEILTTTDSTFFVTIKLMDIATNYILSTIISLGISSIKDLIIIERSFSNSNVFLFERNNSKFVLSIIDSSIDRFINFRKKKKINTHNCTVESWNEGAIRSGGGITINGSAIFVELSK